MTEIKVQELFENEKDLVKVYEKLSSLVLGKEIELYEYNEDSKDYDYIDKYDIKSVQIWEEDQIAFSFGPDEWDICSIKETDLIKLQY
jgi:hypothetical protein